MAVYIPGSLDVEGREFLYVQTTHGEGFRKIIDDALALSLDIPLPADGGVIDENVHVLVDDCISLLGLSYRGDLDGWRERLIACCKATRRLWGSMSGHTLVLSDGTTRALGQYKLLN